MPSRIVLPLANPRTAADLVRIAAALLDHGGSITALGIVEVPEERTTGEHIFGRLARHGPYRG